VAGREIHNAHMKLQSIALLLVGALAGQWWQSRPSSPEASAEVISSRAREAVQPAIHHEFKCEGKTRCSEMACDEAVFYLHNCPGVEIDGDHDGLPCERQCP
jgi:hypothetical protein